MVTENKKYKLDVLATLRELEYGQQVTFCIAGEGMETTYNSLHTTKCNHQLPITIVKSDDGLTATVTKDEYDNTDSSAVEQVAD